MVFGHVAAALAVYLNHRFIFHGRLGRLPILKKLTRLHKLHHAHAYDDKRNDYFEPLWVSLSFYIGVIGIALIVSLPFALGILSFGLLYSTKHRRLHNKDESSASYRHHRHHHMKNPRSNFSGIYPFIDSLFRTRDSA